MARQSKRSLESKKPQEQAALDALEQLERDGAPNLLVATSIMAATLAGFAYFVAQGLREVETGETRLASKLLAVQKRDQPPFGFDLDRLGGGRVSVGDLTGKIVLLNFWATWCPPCIEEMPSMLQLHEKLKGDPKFVMLAVSTDESWEPVKRFFGTSPPGFTVALDPNGRIAQQYGTTMFPETYVLVDGRVRGFIEGPRDWETWYAEAYLRGLLAGDG